MSRKFSKRDINVRVILRILVRRSISDRRHRQEQEDVSIVLWRQTAFKAQLMASTLFMTCYLLLRFNRHRMGTICIRQYNF